MHMSCWFQARLCRVVDTLLCQDCGRFPIRFPFPFYLAGYLLSLHGRQFPSKDLQNQISGMVHSTDQ